MSARFDESSLMPSSFSDNHSRYQGLQHKCSLTPQIDNSKDNTHAPAEPPVKTTHEESLPDLHACRPTSTMVTSCKSWSHALSKSDTPPLSYDTPPTSPGRHLKLLPYLLTGSSVESLTPISPTDHIMLQLFEPQDAVEAAILHDLAFATSGTRCAMQDPSKVEKERVMRAVSFEQACTMSTTRLVKAVDMIGGGKIVGAAGFFIAGGLQWAMSRQPEGDETDFFAVVAEEREKVLQGNYNIWELAQLFVHPSYQRHGIGKQLVEWGLQQADAEGLPVYVESSIAGKGLYERAGFSMIKAVSLPQVRRDDIDVHKRYIMIRPGRVATSVQVPR